MLDIMLVTMDTALAPPLDRADAKRPIALEAMPGSLDRPLLAALTIELHALRIADTPALAPAMIDAAKLAIAAIALAPSIIREVMADVAPALIAISDAVAAPAAVAIPAMPADAIVADVPSMVM